MKKTVLDERDSVAVSGVTGEGINRLLSTVEDVIGRFKRKYTLVIPYTDQSSLSAIYNSYSVDSVEYGDVGTVVTVTLDERGRGTYAKYITHS